MIHISWTRVRYSKSSRSKSNPQRNLSFQQFLYHKFHYFPLFLSNYESIYQLVKPQRNQWPPITSQDPDSDYCTGNQTFNMWTLSRYFISQPKQQCKVSFHMLSSGLHIFFGETLQILGPFLNQVLFIVANMHPIFIFPAVFFRFWCYIQEITAEFNITKTSFHDFF